MTDFIAPLFKNWRNILMCYKIKTTNTFKTRNKIQFFRT